MDFNTISRHVFSNLNLALKEPGLFAKATLPYENGKDSGLLGIITSVS